MITAVDTSILIDIFRNDATFGPTSISGLKKCLADGRVVACEVVWEELAVMFPAQSELNEQMKLAGVEFGSISRDSAHLAGLHWKKFLERGGTRTRVVADFLVAAHAQLQCDRLLTRDRGFYRDYFTELEVVPTGIDT